MNKNTMDTLPPDVKQLIVRHLDPRSMVRVGGVSRQFRDMSSVEQANVVPTLARAQCELRRTAVPAEITLHMHTRTYSSRYTDTRRTASHARPTSASRPNRTPTNQTYYAARADIHNYVLQLYS